MGETFRIALWRGILLMLGNQLARILGLYFWSERSDNVKIHIKNNTRTGGLYSFFWHNHNLYFADLSNIGYCNEIVIFPAEDEHHIHFAEEVYVVKGVYEVAPVYLANAVEAFTHNKVHYKYDVS